MRFRDDARIDTGEVQDRRGGGRAVAIGGGGLGVVGVIVVILFQLLGGGGSGSGSGVDPQVLGPVPDDAAPQPVEVEPLKNTVSVCS